MNGSIDHGSTNTKPKGVESQETKPNPTKETTYGMNKLTPVKDDPQKTTNKQIPPQNSVRPNPEPSDQTGQQKPSKPPGPAMKIKDPSLPPNSHVPNPFQGKPSPFSMDKPGGVSPFQPSFGLPPGFLQSQPATAGFGSLKGNEGPSLYPHHPPSQPAQPLTLSKADKDKIEAAKSMAEDLASKLGSVPNELADLKSSPR